MSLIESLNTTTGIISPENVISFMAKGYTVVKLGDPYHIFFTNPMGQIQKGTYTNSKTTNFYHTFEVEAITCNDMNNMLCNSNTYERDEYMAFYFTASAIKFCLAQIKDKENKIDTTSNIIKNTKNIDKLNEKDIEGDNVVMGTMKNDTLYTSQVLSANDVKKLINSRLAKDDEEYRTMMNELFDMFNHDLEIKIEKHNFDKQTIENDEKHVKIVIEISLPKTSFRVKDSHGQPVSYKVAMYDELAEFVKKSGADNAEIKHMRNDSTSLKIDYSVFVTYVIEV